MNTRLQKADTLLCSLALDGISMWGRCRDVVIDLLLLQEARPGAEGDNGGGLASSAEFSHC